MKNKYAYLKKKRYLSKDDEMMLYEKKKGTKKSQLKICDTHIDGA